MTVSREARSKRLIHRVTLPLRVVVAGQTVEATDWSLGGFGATLNEALPHGTRLTARLIFPLGTADVGFAAQCEVMHTGADGRHGFRFIDLTVDQLELVRQMWIAATTGQVMPLDACLTPVDPPPVHAASPAAVPPVTARRLVGYAVLLMFGVMLLAGLAVSIHARFFVVRADYAAVTVPVVRLRAPVEGRLVGTALAPGVAVPVGTPLFELAAPDLAAEIDLAEAELARQAATVQALRRRRETLQEFFADYVDLAESALHRATAERGRAAASLLLAERDLARWEDLAKAGFAAQSRLDQAEQRYSQAEQGLAAAEAAVEQASANVRMARQGRWFSGSRVEGAEPAKLDDDLRQAEAAHGLQARRLAALSDQHTERLVTSPCDCVVTQALAAPGEWVQAGAVVYLLRPRGDVAVVTVKVAQDKVDLLGLGDRALVRLAGASASDEAVVLVISRAPLADSRFGLPDSVDRDAATVLLQLRSGPIEPAAGTPAQVLFPVSPRRLLFSWGESGRNAEGR